MAQTRWQGCQRSSCSLVRRQHTAADSEVASAAWNVQLAATAPAAAVPAVAWHLTASLHSQNNITSTCKLGQLSVSYCNTKHTNMSESSKPNCSMFLDCLQHVKKVKIAHTRLPSVGFRMLILVLGSQPADDVSHKPCSKHWLPLLSPGLQLPPQPLRRLLLIVLLVNPGPSVPESSTLTTRLPSHPYLMALYKSVYYYYYKNNQSMQKVQTYILRKPKP